jgi:hypothetical protein
VRPPVERLSPGCGSRLKRAVATASVPSVYGTNHTVVVYKTDLKTWENKGVALSPHARISGTEFRPCVIYNAQTKK